MAGSSDKPYDLLERTAVFGECAIQFAKKVPITPVTMQLITQLVKASTSIGANYTEADDAESRKDYRHKTGISRKESKETRFWLRMIVASESDLSDEAGHLSQEAHELNRIFGSIIRKVSRGLE